MQDKDNKEGWQIVETLEQCEKFYEWKLGNIRKCFLKFIQSFRAIALRLEPCPNMWL